MLQSFSVHPFKSFNRFINILKTGQYKQPWFQVLFCLFIMSTHWVAIESWSGISPIKVIYMCLCSMLLIGLGRRANSEIIFLTGLYYSGVLISAFLLSNGSFSITSICYMVLFLFTYCYFISLLYSGALTYDLALRFLRGMILAYFLFIVIQQVAGAVGLRIKLLNIHGYIWGWKFPGMNIEPSHCGRLMMVIFFVFVEMIHLKEPRGRSIGYLLQHERIPFIAFIYSMATMGSGMGIAGLILIMLYLMAFTNRASFIIGVLTCILIVFLIKDTESFNRFWRTVQAAATLDESLVQKADNSASARVNILLGTAHNLKVSDYGFWVGYGKDSDILASGILVTYGFIVFILQLIFLFRFSFRGLLSLEVVMFAIFNCGTLGNVAYVWAMVMYWTLLKYFTIQEKTHQVKRTNTIQLITG